MCKVLVIDDDQDILDMLSLIFKRSGIEMKGMTNALELTQHLVPKPAMIMLDVHLEGDNGINIYRKLKSDTEAKEIPVYIFTGTSKDDLNIDFEPDGFIEKPFNIAELVNKVRAHCPSVIA